ncbi:adenosine deaminase [Rhodobacteraceae bacterium RKSG542]|uniref:adenosine deaminase n=1 Tax=Pseudovibrio flavus TaxID=2529854 RepID=UPI0012BCEC7E|nr:adenosine deaminase [Pseudovibrio flavus]MTI16511.1 adenosine deaminase [Pseudovibrio flavus]
MSDLFFNKFPKAELHCHLYGTIREETLADFVRASGEPLPVSEVPDYYVRGDKPKGVLHIFRMMEEHILGNTDRLYRLTYECLEDEAREGVRYIELFWNYTETGRFSGQSYATLQSAILAAMRDAEKDLGIVSRLIPAVDRERSEEAAAELVELAIQHRTDEVVGIGIDYRENDHPPENFWKAYQLARRAGLKTTAHAGEFGCHHRNVETAIDLLKVDRIDHGYTVLDCPELTKRCADMGMVFTVVPTNSYYLRTLKPEEWAQKHPIRFMKDAGIKIHPNTDDPTFHNVTPALAWKMMVRDFGYSIDDLREFTLNGLDGAFIDDVTRRQWKREWIAEFDALRAEHVKD